MKKKENFIYENFLKSVKYIYDSRRFIYFTGILFFVIAVLGFIFPIFFEEEILSLIEKLILEAEGLNIWELFIFIFTNNFLVSLFTLFFGIFLGFFPVFNMIVNGYVVGFVCSKTVELEGIFSLWRLLPHGIFEIPAILISSGLGVKLGITLVSPKKNFKEIFKNSLISFILVVVPLLCLAGIIESSLVYFLK